MRGFFVFSDAMADVEYEVEEFMWIHTVPVLSFPLPDAASRGLWARMEPARRYGDPVASEFLGIDENGVPFIDLHGGVLSHEVRVINGVPFLSEVNE